VEGGEAGSELQPEACLQLQPANEPTATVEPFHQSFHYTASHLMGTYIYQAMGGILLSSVLLELHKLSAAAASLKQGEAGNKARHGSFQRGAYMLNLSQRMVSRRGVWIHRPC
jgi:hypothetical protein